MNVIILRHTESVLHLRIAVPHCALRLRVAQVDRPSQVRLYGLVAVIDSVPKKETLSVCETSAGSLARDR